MLRNLFLVVPFLLLVHVTSAAALPPCPGSYNPNTWTNCEGTYTTADGSVYVGEWKDGTGHGHGTYTYPDGDKYVGEFKDGKKHGHGTYTYGLNSDNSSSGRELSGSVCDCNWLNDEANGNGTIFWANGDVWVGRMSNNDWLAGNKYTAGNVPPEVYASRGGDAPPSSQQQTQRPDSDEIIPASSGSGFVISKSGHIVTNHHVIAGCNQVHVHHQGNSLPANLLAMDPVNDLAVVQVEFTPTTIFPISNSNAELLQDIYVAGFPFGYGYSTTIKVTKGVVSSLAGPMNNYSELQIDAALQAGNSGGPILDEGGNVVGVAVAKMDSDWALENLGSVPDDINFGIKSSVLKSFLEANGIKTLKPSTKAISRTELGKKITDGTLFLSCLMTYAQIEKLRAEKVMFSDLD